jgi:hypothetical protein
MSPAPDFAKGSNRPPLRDFVGANCNTVHLSTRKGRNRKKHKRLKKERLFFSLLCFLWFLPLFRGVREAIVVEAKDAYFVAALSTNVAISTNAMLGRTP